MFWSFACYPAALLGVVEATINGIDEMTRLCPPIRYWDESRDYLSSCLALMAHERAHAACPDIAAWAKGTRLNPLSGLGVHREHPLVTQTWGELKQYGAAAAANLASLLR